MPHDRETHENVRKYLKTCQELGLPKQLADTVETHVLAMMNLGYLHSKPNQAELGRYAS